MTTHSNLHAKLHRRSHAIKEPEPTCVELLKQDLRHYPELPHRENVALILRAQDGDGYAYSRAILHNMGLVIEKANQASRQWNVNIDDAIQDGYFGLRKAIERFKYDPNKDNHFSTYAVWWIWSFIRRATIYRQGDIHVPEYVHRKWLVEYKAAKASGGALPPSRAPIYIPLHFNDPDRDGTIGENLSDPNAAHAEEQAELADDVALMMSAANLNKTERATLILAFGLDGVELKQWQIARRLKLTPQAISSAYNTGLAKMRVAAATLNVQRRVSA